MKITGMTMMILLAGATAYGQSSPAAERKVSVCFDARTIALDTVGRARMLAYKMFGNIGVNIDWRFGLHHCPANAIIVSLRTSTPATLKPGALAFALPYEGAHIEIFYDRVSQYGDATAVSTVLAHVLVHEITHILQGISRHSVTGVMKAHWDNRDIFQMKGRPLQFTPEDIDLIYIGLAARARRPMLAMNRKPPLAGQ